MSGMDSRHTGAAAAQARPEHDDYNFERDQHENEGP